MFKILRNTEIIFSTRRKNIFSFDHMVGERSLTSVITIQYKTSLSRGGGVCKQVKLIEVDRGKKLESED